MGIMPPNLRPDLDALRVDVAVAALRDAVKDGWSILGLSTGMVDAFTDQTGIASLGGAIYDGSGKLITSNPGGYGPNVFAGATVTAQSTNGGSGAASVLVDGGTATKWKSSAAAPQWLHFDCGVGAAFKPARLKIYLHADDIGGVQGWALYGSNTGAFSGEEASVASGSCPSSEGWQVFAFSAPSLGYRYFALVVTSAYSGGNPQAYEVELAEVAVPSAVTVVSSAFALGFQPSMARIVAPMEMGSGIVGTNGLLDLSRDGSAWAAVPLSDLGKFDASTRIVGGLVNLAGQPAGSSIYWRWRTTSGIAQALHGVWVQCK